LKPNPNQQCEGHEFEGQCEGHEYEGQCERHEFEGQYEGHEFEGQCEGHEFEGQCEGSTTQILEHKEDQEDENHGERALHKTIIYNTHIRYVM
jgi:hypothetical protein